MLRSWVILGGGGGGALKMLQLRWWALTPGALPLTAGRLLTLLEH